MTVYLSGPITGKPDYREAFEKAAELVRSFGDEPVNPAGLEPTPGKPAHEYLLEDLQALSRCGGIYFLPGARDSRGSMIERAFAEYARICEVRYDKGRCENG